MHSEWGDFLSDLSLVAGTWCFRPTAAGSAASRRSRCQRFASIFDDNGDGLIELDERGLRKWL